MVFAPHYKIIRTVKNSVLLARHRRCLSKKSKTNQMKTILATTTATLDVTLTFNEWAQYIANEINNLKR